MRIAEFAVKNRQFTLVVFFALLVMGAFSIVTIPRAEDPTFPIPIYPIAIVYPGATPTDIEQLVVDPIEDKIRALEGLIDVKTTIEDGLAVIQPEFDVSVDADRKYDEMVREINALRPTLPQDLARLEVIRINASDVNIAQFALVSETAPWTELDRAARGLRDDLARLPGVKESATWGYPRREVRVALDAGRLAELRIPLATVIQAIGGESVNIPGGSVDAGRRRFNVKTSGSYRSLDEVRETVIGGGAGATVRVGDVARVEWDYEEAASHARLDGKRAVWVTANMQERQNIMAVRDRLWAAADAAEAALPAGITMERPFDQSANVRMRLSRLSMDFMIAILLVLLTLLPLGFRASWIVMVSIPLSLAIGVTLLKAVGFTINQLSIVGFVIALGLLVDDSIVVTENIARRLREGMSRFDAAIAGSKQIGVAVIGCTATLMLAFTPLLFLPEGAGAFIRSLPAAVLFTVAASLVVSLTIIPVLASRMLPEHEGPEGNWLLQKVMAGIESFYRPLLRTSLAAPRTTLLVATGLFLASLLLIPRLGFSLFPPAEIPEVLVNIELPDGAAMTETGRVLNQVEKIVSASKDKGDVRWLMSNLGHGNPQVFYNIR
ncbi:MAG: efflux RND transporter permease subunit, partial [Gemmatimonadetes bacterium]|nr:efflux RND transporter permease subunit [Gemmatimonadota bacterium]